MKSAKSFESLRIGHDGKVTLDSPEKIEISKLKSEIELLKTQLQEEKDAGWECNEKLAQALRAIEARDNRPPIGYLCTTTKQFSTNQYTKNDIAVFDKYDRFVHKTI